MTNSPLFPVVAILWFIVAANYFFFGGMDGFLGALAAIYLLSAIALFLTICLITSSLFDKKLLELQAQIANNYYFSAHVWVIFGSILSAYAGAILFFYVHQIFPFNLVLIKMLKNLGFLIVAYLFLAFLVKITKK